jgi:hypothetical protein
MIPIPLPLPRLRFTLRSLCLGIAASTAIFALFTRIARPAEQAAFALLLGIILPSIWVAAWRRSSLDGLLARVALIGVLDFLLVEGHGGGRLLFLGLVSLSLLIPSIGWYMASRMEPGAGRDRVYRALPSFLVELGLVASQVAASFLLVGLVLRF